MRYKTYAEIAGALGVDYCGDDGLGHDEGYVSMDGAPHGRSPRVHWKERRVTRSGVRRFLKHVWRADGQTIIDEPAWLRLWKQIEWVRFTASRRLHVIIPPDLWAEDKARLAAKIAASPDDVDLKEERERALRWARR